MIKVYFYKKENKIVKFEIKGHANNKVVCASLSGMLWMVVRSLKRLFNVECFGNISGGYAVSEFVESEGGKLLLMAFRIGVEELKKKFPEEVEIYEV